MKTYPTEGLDRLHGQAINIEGVDTATPAEAMEGCLRDLLRRARAGELVSLTADAVDVNGNRLRVRPLAGLRPKEAA